MAAARAQGMNIQLSITIATPEDAPLAIFGKVASEAVRQLLEDNGILTVTSAYCEVHEPGCVAINRGERHLHADRIVAMPELHGMPPRRPQAGRANISVSATQTGLSPPSRSKVSSEVSMTPPDTSSTAPRRRCMRTRSPTGSAAGKRSLLRP